MVDFIALSETAQRLIEENGRPVTLSKKSETPSDPTKPWLGTTSASASVSVIAVLFDYDSNDIDGDLIRRNDQKALIADDSLSGQNLREYDELTDTGDGQKWKIINVNLVRPGTKKVVWELQLRQ